MGSTLSARLCTVDENEHLDIIIGGDKKEALKGRDVCIDLHLESGPDNFISVSGLWLVDEFDGQVLVEEDAPQYFTITCVADWLWFILALNRYYGDHIHIKDCRPDPYELLPA